MHNRIARSPFTGIFCLSIVHIRTGSVKSDVTPRGGTRWIGGGSTATGAGFGAERPGRRGGRRPGGSIDVDPSWGGVLCGGSSPLAGGGEAGPMGREDVVGDA
jgi:hypothetical protein